MTITALFFSFAIPADGQAGTPTPKITSTVISAKGGEWKDDFFNYLDASISNNVGSNAANLQIKLTEYVDWTQTFSGHFVPGEFFQTETVSDSVRLAFDGGSNQFYTVGIYTSTVFYAVRSVDWVSATWSHSEVPDRVIIEFRTGDTAIPDNILTTGTNCGFGLTLCYGLI